MNILIATTSGVDFHDAVVQFLQSHSSGDTNISLISVVEPSPVVDFTLSVSGETMFRQILDERVSEAEADMNSLCARLVNMADSSHIQSTTIVGFKSEVVRVRAERMGADVILISATDAPNLVLRAPCTVVALKPIRRTA